MVLTINRNANSCEDLYWDTVRDRYVLYAHANSGMGGSPDKRDWNKLNAGETKKGGRWSFFREEFRNYLQTVTVAVEEGSDKRDQGPIQWRSGKT